MITYRLPAAPRQGGMYFASQLWLCALRRVLKFLSFSVDRSRRQTGQLN